jgi:hypothetical protein
MAGLLSYNVYFQDMSDSTEQIDSIIKESHEYFLRGFEEALSHKSLIPEVPVFSEEAFDDLREKFLTSLQKQM